MKSEDYLVQLDLFLQNVKSHNPNAEILITSAPPSLFQRKYPNFFVADYAQKISNLAVDSNYAFWDMYAQLGGLYGIRRNFNQGLMANDRVHYSKSGYEKQGNLLSEAILKAFEVYQNSIKQ
jgi:lysophospholipase L1-like esterase